MAHRKISASYQVRDCEYMYHTKGDEVANEIKKRVAEHLGDQLGKEILKFTEIQSEKNHYDMTTTYRAVVSVVDRSESRNSSPIHYYNHPGVRNDPLRQIPTNELPEELSSSYRTRGSIHKLPVVNIEKVRYEKILKNIETTVYYLEHGPEFMGPKDVKNIATIFKNISDDLKKLTT